MEAAGCPEIKEASNMNEYMMNAKEADRLVYCRFGEKYIADMEKRKNSNISALNTPAHTAFNSASYLINVKKLIEENNIDGEKKDFKNLKTTNLGK